MNKTGRKRRRGGRKRTSRSRKTRTNNKKESWFAFYNIYNM